MSINVNERPTGIVAGHIRPVLAAICGFNDGRDSLIPGNVAARRRDRAIRIGTIRGRAATKENDVGVCRVDSDSHIVEALLITKCRSGHSGKTLATIRALKHAEQVSGTARSTGYVSDGNDKLGPAGQSIRGRANSDANATIISGIRAGGCVQTGQASPR